MQTYSRLDIRSQDGSELGTPEQPVLLRRAAAALNIPADDLAQEVSLSEAQVAQALR